jgi:hypothetical protein
VPPRWVDDAVGNSQPKYYHTRMETFPATQTAFVNPHTQIEQERVQYRLMSQVAHVGPVASSHNNRNIRRSTRKQLLNSLR